MKDIDNKFTTWPIKEHEKQFHPEKGCAQLTTLFSSPQQSLKVVLFHIMLTFC